MRRLLRVVRRGVGPLRWAVVAGVAGGLLVVTALLVVIVYLPQLAIDPHGLSRTDWLNAVQAVRTSILQGLGGLAVLAGAVLAALNLRETSRQNRAVLEVQRRGQTTERFTRAIEQLGQQGSKRLDVRIGVVSDAGSAQTGLAPDVRQVYRADPAAHQGPRGPRVCVRLPYGCAVYHHAG